MIYRILADLAVAIHVAFVLFVVLGGLPVLRWRWVALVHLPAAVWGALIEFLGWVCPLTYLENELRRRSGDAGYGGGFVEHYLAPVLYPSGLTRGAQVGIGIFVLAVNAVVYGLVLYRLFRKRRDPGDQVQSS